MIFIYSFCSQRKPGFALHYDMAEHPQAVFMKALQAFYPGSLDYDPIALSLIISTYFSPLTTYQNILSNKF